MEKKATKMYKDINQMQADAIEEIVRLMKENNLDEVNLSVDENGVSMWDENVDQEWMDNHTINVMVELRWGATNKGIMNKMVLRGDRIAFYAELAEGDEELYPQDYMYLSVEHYVDALSYLESKLEYQSKKKGE